MQDFAAGWVAGVAGLTVGYPLDTLKVQMQLSESGTLRDALRSIEARRMFSGLLSPIASYGVLIALNFGCYSIASRALVDAYPHVNEHALHAVGGLCSGGVHSCVYVRNVSVCVVLFLIVAPKYSRAVTRVQPVRAGQDSHAGRGAHSAE